MVQVQGARSLEEAAGPGLVAVRPESLIPPTAVIDGLSEIRLVIKNWQGLKGAIVDQLQTPASGLSSPPGRATPRQDERQLYTRLTLMDRRLNFVVSVDPRTAADLRKIKRLRHHPRLLLALGACIIIFLIWQRCPTVISRAEFWAEDGWVWYPQCYAHGWHCLFLDHSSYLQTISMLVALLSLLRPLTDAPKIFAFAALLLQAAPAIFLLSSRMSAAIPLLAIRLALALLLVAIPGMKEVYVNVTNSQWHLSLLAFLILCAARAETWPARIFDTLALVVCGLSGPFAPLLVPVALLWWWLRHERWRLWRLAVVLATAAVQISLIVAHHASRDVAGPGIGWSLGRLINIVVVNVLGVAAFGRTTLIDDYWSVGQGWLSNGSLPASLVGGSIMAAALTLAIIAFLRGPWILRSFLIFAGLEFGTSLVDGLTTVQPLWVALEGWIGMRYYFHPIAAWLAVLVSLVCDRSLPLRGIGIALLALTVVFAIPADWRLPRHQPTNFRTEAKAFAKAPTGTVMAFPEAPSRDMVLIKH